MPNGGESKNAKGRAPEEATGGAREPAGSLFSNPKLTPVLSVVAALLLGVGGYSVGKATGSDLDQARSQGAELGVSKGARQGAAKGYSTSFPKARAKAYRKAYIRSYRSSYAKAFTEAGLEKPEAKSIKVSR